jgi:hypothetical protein
MPQTIEGRLQNTITLPVDDLCTVTIAGSGANFAIKNNGPGALWFSIDPETDAAVSGVFSTLLNPGESYYEGKRKIGPQVTLIASGDVAVVSLNL